MKRFTPVLVVVILLIAIYFTGFMVQYSLAHAWWHTNATLAGGAGGTIVAILLIWKWNAVAEFKYKTVLEILLVGLFGLAIYMTYTAGRTFIDSAVFEVQAGRIWHYGYHSVVFMYVLTATYFVKKIVFHESE